MLLLKKIRQLSHEVDERFQEWCIGSQDFVIQVPVPGAHPRSEHLESYPVRLGDFQASCLQYGASVDSFPLFIVASSVAHCPFVVGAIQQGSGTSLVLESSEAGVKTIDFAGDLITSLRSQLSDTQMDPLIVVGGGLLLNVGAFVAERLAKRLVLFPTTVLSMADGSGGKVRLNKIAFGRAYKHYYKSFYEPDEIIIDSRFLDSLPRLQVRIGLVEIIKHGLFQSACLYDFLTAAGKELFHEKSALLKAILWAADLKRICLSVDAEENDNGSRSILRAGHDFSDRLEEDLRLSIPHGFAVAIGIVRALEAENRFADAARAVELFRLFEIPTTIEEWSIYEASCRLRTFLLAGEENCATFERLRDVMLFTGGVRVTSEKAEVTT